MNVVLPRMVTEGLGIATALWRCKVKVIRVAAVLLHHRNAQMKECTGISQMVRATPTQLIVLITVKKAAPVGCQPISVVIRWAVHTVSGNPIEAFFVVGTELLS